MKSLQQSALLLQDMKHLVAELASLSRLSTCFRCAARMQIRNNEVPSSETKSFPGSRDSKQKSTYIFTALGLGAGLLIGAFLKTYHSDKSFLNFLPAVRAATPFGIDSFINDSNNNVTNPPSPPSSKRKSCNFVADVVEKVSDGVVYIEIKDNRGIYVHSQTISNGSGFIVSEDGLILTNAHVVTNRPRSSTLVVRLQDGSEYCGVIEDVDTISDLALVRIKCQEKMKPVKLGKSSDIRPGEFVAAIGSPLSLSNTVTVGVVSSVGRASKELGLRGRDIQYIQTDAAITFGNSGGPLVNLDGEVIGINSLTVTSGISFAIPVEYATDFMKKAEKKRIELGNLSEPSAELTRLYLGVTMVSLTPNTLNQLQMRGITFQSIPQDLEHGVIILKVVVGSPSYRGGLRPGDIITHVNNKKVTYAIDVYKLLEKQKAANMVVIRDGKLYTVSVIPEE